MITGKVLKSALLVALGLASASHADTVKYLVKFKSPETFAAVKSAVVQSTESHIFRAAGDQSSAGTKLMGTNATVAESLDHIQMMIVESADPKAIESLRNHPAVALVEQEIIHPAPRPLATWSASPMRKKKKQKTKMDRPWGIDSVKAPEAWASTQGASSRVMVLDTGLDVSHPAVSGRFEQGRNFTGGSTTDISDQVGHGTHVAGTILASGQRGDLVGVAPRARLLMGKVCSLAGCSSAAIAAGINWAVAEKADVVNMSLGGSMISEGEAQAIRAAEEAGVFIAAASGNDGTPRVSFPAAVESITAVGAIDNTNTKAQFSQWGPELDVVAPGVDVISSVPQGTGRGAEVKIDAGKGVTNAKTLPFVGSPLRTVQGQMVFCGLGKTADFKNLNLTGKIALISRGEIPFKDKVNNAIAKGATAVVIFNNAPGLIQGSLSEDGSEVAIPAVMIEQTLGEEAKAALLSGRGASVSLAVEATDYASFQGTSMATPHVAGVAALIRAANHSLTPSQVRDILKQTATPLGPNTQNEYGSGLVNAAAAVRMAHTFSPLMRVAN